jgi:hypothetical protein
VAPLTLQKRLLLPLVPHDGAALADDCRLEVLLVAAYVPAPVTVFIKDFPAFAAASNITVAGGMPVGGASFPPAFSSAAADDDSDSGALCVLLMWFRCSVVSLM